MHLAADFPDPWPHGDVFEENAALRLEGDFLSEDFCVLGGKYFMVRAVLEIPVHGFAKPFGFGCWSTLSRVNFDKYIEGFDDGFYPDVGPWSGWLVNQVADYIGTKPEGAWLSPQTDRQRPLLQTQDPTHPLAIDQTNGITAERVLEIFAQYGHAPAV
jgi:hypothetical protein